MTQYKNLWHGLQNMNNQPCKFLQDTKLPGSILTLSYMFVAWFMRQYSCTVYITELVYYASTIAYDTI